MGAEARNIVIVGLELGDGPLIDAWSRAGRLPVLGQLIAEGCWGWLDTTADQLHISAWPCLYTGATPGEHGVYFTFQPAPGVQGYTKFHIGQYGRPTFWQLLDQAGRRCAVLDAPYTHAEEGYKGVYVNDWGTWAHYLAPGSVPSQLLKRLEAACGRYPLGIEANDLGLSPLEATETARQLVRSIEAKAKATCWLMHDQSPEVLVSVFGETHVSGHYCWSPQLAELAASPMLDVYKAVDRAIGQIAAAAGRETTLLIVSGDCGGPNNAGWHLLPELLARLGYLAKPQRQSQEGGAQVGGSGKFDPVKVVRDMLPKDFRKNLARMMPTKLRDKLAQRVDMAEIDWSRTRAYCLPTDLEGYIRVNLRGREPEGIVEPGMDFEHALQDLGAALHELTDPVTGHRIVREVVRASDAFPGDCVANLPDLVVRWDPTAPITAVTSPRVGTISKASADPRTGTHRGPGFFIGRGPGIAAGSKLRGGHILDFAPTLLTRLGVEVPSHMHGEIWPELATPR